MSGSGFPTSGDQNKAFLAYSRTLEVQFGKPVRRFNSNPLSRRGCMQPSLQLESNVLPDVVWHIFVFKNCGTALCCMPFLFLYKPFLFSTPKVRRSFRAPFFGGPSGMKRGCHGYSAQASALCSLALSTEAVALSGNGHTSAP